MRSDFYQPLGHQSEWMNGQKIEWMIIVHQHLKLKAKNEKYCKTFQRKEFLSFVYYNGRNKTKINCVLEREEQLKI